MNKGTRPTGIIRTLPTLYKDVDNIGHRRYRESLKQLEAGRIEAIYIALSQMPKADVLHIYLLIDGFVGVRLNIAGYEPGEKSEIKCWDETIRSPKWWVLCTGPVSYPPEKMPRRGFQGFRYTEDLW